MQKQGPQAGNIGKIAPRVLILAGLGILLTGCASGKIGSIVGGECGVFPRPAVQMFGADRISQNWADDVTESGVGACGWKRPEARPRPVAKTAPIVTKPVKTRWWQRYRRKPAVV